MANIVINRAPYNIYENRTDIYLFIYVKPLEYLL